MENSKAILLLHCPNQEGVIAATTAFIHDNNGNIVALEQHVEELEKELFMRIEWELKYFIIPAEKIGEFFQTLVADRFKMKWRLEFNNKIPRIGLFVSKYSHCFFDILSRYESKEWKVEIPLIISNHEKFEHVAKRYNIPYYHIPITKENKKEAEQKEIQLLKEHKVDLIVLARYMQVVTSDFINEFPNKIINIHHSSLPAFPGAKPYDSAYKRGVKLVGATAHYVTEDLDAGPIITQEVIPISHKDRIRDLKRKGKNTEKIVLAKAVKKQMDHKVIPYKNRTVVFA